MQETTKQYSHRVLGYVSGKDPLKVQRETCKTLARIIKPLTRKQLSLRPEPDKWSIAEILAHLADTEIIISWRMRKVICQNGAPMQVVDQDLWSTAFDNARRDPLVSLETFRAFRDENLRMLSVLPKKLWKNYGIHTERGKETIAQIVRMYAGHDLNHLAQVEKIAKASRRLHPRKGKTKLS